MVDVPFTQGLHKLSGECHVWHEPDGSWGWSNSGLVVGRDAALLVDTLFDVPMTRRMLDEMTVITDEHPITTVFNTHSNGDHWFGNQLLKDTEILSTTSCLEEMRTAGWRIPTALLGVSGVAGEFGREIFSPFDWSDLEPTFPTKTFDKELTLDVGGIEVQLIRLGPAHTSGDAIAYVPSAKTLYSGDLLFIGGTPIIWAGPLANWVAACDFMHDLDVEIVVPGHGPVTDKQGILQVRRYLEYVDEQAREKFAAGVPAEEAARQISLEQFASWAEGGRIIQNVLAVYYELDPTMSHWSAVDVFEQIALLEARDHPKKSQ